VCDSGPRQRLRSASISALVVPPSRRETTGDRAFPVVSARVSNSVFVTGFASFSAINRHMKTFLLANHISSPPQDTPVQEVFS